jgi:LPS-assembly lipoprotein
MFRTGSSILSSSRSLALVGLAALCGCGFSPLYAQGGDSTPVAARLDTVEVANIPERTGQLLRQSLQTQLHTAGAPGEQDYQLSVSYAIDNAQIGEQADSSFTRQRFTARATWKLAPIGDPAHPLATGQATTEDALNVIDQQYFAEKLETDTVDRQLANEIAARITTQLAVYFKTHRQA